MIIVNDIASLKWKDNTGKFPDSVLQISNINSGTGAENVIPGELNFKFNVRYSPSITAEKIKEEVENILKSHEVEFESEWKESGLPFLTEEKELIDAVTSLSLIHI